MDGQQISVRISFDAPTRAEAARAVQELREAVVRRVGNEVVATIEREDPDSQDAGSTLVLIFGTSTALAIAQGVRSFLARRGDDRDRITIKTSDGTEVIATGEAARKLDAAALVRATSRRTSKG